MQTDNVPTNGCRVFSTKVIISSLEATRLLYGKSFPDKAINLSFYSIVVFPCSLPSCPTKIYILPNTIEYIIKNNSTKLFNDLSFERKTPNSVLQNTCPHQYVFLMVRISEPVRLFNLLFLKVTPWQESIMICFRERKQIPFTRCKDFVRPFRSRTQYWTIFKRPVIRSRMD